MKWKIVMDSSCDMQIMDGLNDNIGFATVPLRIVVGEKEFLDTAGLNTKEMMREVYAYEGVSRTACPSPEAWRKAFLGCEHVIAITISSNLSGSFESANVAKQLLEEEPEAPDIFILDSLSTGPEMGLLAEKAAELITQGRTFSEVCVRLKKYKQKTRVMCILERMENLVKNGRVKRMTAWVAGLLNIKITAKGSKEGTIEMVGKDRGREKTYQHFVERLKACGPVKKILISHCNNEEGAKALKQKLQEAFQGIKIGIQPTGGLCSFYAEDHGLIIAYELG